MMFAASNEEQIECQSTSQETVMLQNTSGPPALQVTAVGKRLVVPAEWRTVEGLQTHLQRHGIGSTIHLDPLSHEACLEIWPEVDPARAQAALNDWPG
jgi:hypothetical protein